MSKLPPTANQSHPHASRLHLRASATLTPSTAFLSPKTNIWLFHPQKNFFSKNLNVNKKFTKIHNQFVLKSHVRIRVAETQRRIV